MFTDQMNLKDGLGTNIAQFNLTHKDQAETKRVDTASTAQQPRTLLTRHQMGNGVNAVDRHVVSVQQTLLDQNNKAFTMTASISIVLPRTALFDLAKVRQNLEIVSAYLGTDNASVVYEDDKVAALLRGES